jgi:hypothetical protein
MLVCGRGPQTKRRLGLHPMKHHQKYLAQANRHIAELAVQIRRQRVIVKHALATGQRLEMAESLLDALEGSLRVFEKHRIFLLSYSAANNGQQRKSPGSEAGARLGFACHGGHRDVIASATTGICPRSIRRNAIADDANSAAPFAPDKGLPLGIGDKVGANRKPRASRELVAVWRYP